MIATVCAAAVAAYLALIPLAIKGVGYLLNAPARNAAKDAAQHQFERYKLPLNRAVLGGDPAAVERAIASPVAVVLDEVFDGSEIELKIGVGDMVYHGGGFNATRASAVGCAQMTAILGAKPIWRAVACPKNIAQRLKLAKPVYKVTLSVTP